MEIDNFVAELVDRKTAAMRTDTIRLIGISTERKQLSCMGMWSREQHTHEATEEIYNFIRFIGLFSLFDIVIIHASFCYLWLGVCECAVTVAV